MNLFEAVFSHALDAPALVFGGREISYGELRLATLQMAHAITSLGVQRGDRVALLLHDSPEFVEAFIATCSLGAIAVPINMALRLDEQCSILNNCGATFALSEPGPHHYRTSGRAPPRTTQPTTRRPRSFRTPTRSILHRR